MNLVRRRVIGAGVAGGALGMSPLSFVFAQSGSPGALLRVPKRALVIGNSKYRHAPLKNPVNDAQGMAAALKSTGFEVTLGLELSQADLRDAIRAYSESLIKAKAVGLFYFAGHGVQLAWRNYLIPVDADIASPEELRARALDMNSLIEGIRKAGNPMNIVIVDACRDNPFGSRGQADQKGLSQIDAPPGTLLAYATAPGNTANDGDGDNGLYTEHLLREMKVPEAKVEDIFKRVRLGVRRKSNGQQIPWESTSLEEDFWFIAPRELRKLAEAEAARAFAEELAVWEGIQNVTEPGPLEGYLRRYPSGRFTELAQLRLDQVLAKQGEKRVEVISPPQNPYSKGSARASTAYKIGDTYAYREIDLYTRQETDSFAVTVTGITDHEIIYNKGAGAVDLLGNDLKVRGGALWGPNQIIPLEYVVGKRWNTRFRILFPKGHTSTVELELQIKGREVVPVPAGSFNAFRVEAKGWALGDNTNAQWDMTRWYAPDRLRRWIATEMRVTAQRGQVINAFRRELVSYKEL